MSLDHKAHVEHASPVEPSVVESKTPWFKTLTGKIAVGAAALVTAVGIGVGVGASVNSGEGRQEPSVGAPQDPSPEVTPTAESTTTPIETTPEESEPGQSSEADSYTEGIPFERLMIHEQTMSFEQMNELSDLEFAKLNVGDRAAWLYRFVSDNCSRKLYSTIDDDNTSFDNQWDTGGVFAIESWRLMPECLPGTPAGSGRKMALAKEFRPIDPMTSEIFDHLQENMGDYERYVTGSGVLADRVRVLNESTWLQVDNKQNSDEKEWAKAIYFAGVNNTTGDILYNQTIQLVRVTTKLEDGTTVYAYMKGNVNSGGDGVDEISRKPV